MQTAPLPLLSQPGSDRAADPSGEATGEGFGLALAAAMMTPTPVAQVPSPAPLTPEGEILANAPVATSASTLASTAQNLTLAMTGEAIGEQSNVNPAQPGESQASEPGESQASEDGGPDSRPAIGARDAAAPEPVVCGTDGQVSKGPFASAIGLSAGWNPVRPATLDFTPRLQIAAEPGPAEAESVQLPPLADASAVTSPDIISLRGWAAPADQADGRLAAQPAPTPAPAPAPAEASAQVVSTSAPLARKTDTKADINAADPARPDARGQTSAAIAPARIMVEPAAAEAANDEAVDAFALVAERPDGQDPHERGDGARTLDAGAARQTQAPAPVTVHAVRGSPQTVAALSSEIARKLEARHSRFDVALDPHGLGRVDVKVEVGPSGALAASLNFDNPQSAELLRARQHELQAALEQAGFDLSGGISFTSGGADDRASRQRQTHDAAPMRAHALSQAADDLAVPRSHARRTANGRLDIRI